MVAKIVKGKSFKGVINYVLDKAKQTELIASEGVRLKSRESIIRNFITQAGLNPKVSKTVGHISLDFSAQDKDKLTNEKMVQIAKEYMTKMGIINTQYIIGRHYDKEHPHIHIVFNRIDNDGKTISDRNDRYRSEKICKELTEKHGLYFAQGKENVKRHRLKEPDKTKYEIFDALNATIPKCKNWKDLNDELKKQGIVISLKYKGNTNEVQGIRFEKNGYIFNGSKIDRQFSYSKIDFQLKQNDRTQDIHVQSAHNHSQNQSSVLENTVSALGGLFDIPTSGTNYDPDEAELMRQTKPKKKKKRGYHL
ncbi:mobilization protein [Bacteroidia bacterium]|uniref:Relaxase/mobilization nuclease domain-containing protein n=1 Tax=Dysgonomonas termitidis TaxID=1516126 RepID=A0ABV9L2X4_9BACT|nr:mobilization protein [Bacteroidia bacterium]